MNDHLDRLSAYFQRSGINPGRKDWSKFENTVAEFFNILFCPPLSRATIQASDWNGYSRRDLVMPNRAEGGPWLFLRQRYAAEYILVDAKNAVKGATKQDILQVGNYLRAEGVGLFAIIMARAAPDMAAIYQAREAWIRDSKMILVMTDEDAQRMIDLKRNGDDPALVVIDKVDRFRMSI